MKTEELLRYEAEYRVMGEAFGTLLLEFNFPKSPDRSKNVGVIHELPLPQSPYIHNSSSLHRSDSP